MRDFEFKGGTLALNFVDTVAGRAGDSPAELWTGADSYAAWAARAGFDLGADDGISRTDLESAKALREAIWRCLGAVMVGGEPAGADVDMINRAARHSPFRPQFRHGAVVMVADDPAAALLSSVAADAIARLDPAARDRLRRCPGCQMYFFDTSPPAKRVWCSSAVGCGNRFKKKRHYARQQNQQ